MVLKDEVLGTINIVPHRITNNVKLIFSQHICSDYDHSNFPNWINTIDGVDITWGLIELNEDIFVVDTFDTNRTFIRAKKNCVIKSNIHIFSQFSYNLLLNYKALLVVTNLFSHKQNTLFNSSQFINISLDCDPYTHDIFLKKNENILQLDLLLFKNVDDVLVNLC